MDVSMIIPISMGLAAGWVVNYLADVLPHDLRLSPALCPNPACKAAFRWMDYLFRTRCPKCGAWRRWRTFAVMILAEALALFTWFSPPHTLGFYPGFVLLTYLLLVAVIDLEHRLILRPLSIAGLLLAASVGFFARGWLETLVGGAVGFALMFAFYQFGRLFSRWRARKLGTTDVEEALGSGDVTLAAILGLLLGWPGITMGLLLGILFGGAGSLVVILWMLVRRNYNSLTAIPYAPFLILSATFLLFSR